MTFYENPDLSDSPNMPILFNSFKISTTNQQNRIHNQQSKLKKKKSQLFWRIDRVLKNPIDSRARRIEEIEMRNWENRFQIWEEEGRKYGRERWEKTRNQRVRGFLLGKAENVKKERTFLELSAVERESSNWSLTNDRHWVIPEAPEEGGFYKC